ncbi:MAG: hypothetical protein MUP81_00685 [Dehalococcoidia bacterium]|nr:hypothetical protein [Dehalococcoidia bacterium]
MAVRRPWREQKEGEGEPWWQTALNVVSYPFQQMGQAVYRTAVEPWQEYAEAEGTPWERAEQVREWYHSPEQMFAQVSPIAGIPLTGQAAKSAFTPSGTEYQKYQQLPTWAQLALEAPGMAATMGVTAGGIRGLLAGTAKTGGILGRTAEVTSAAFKPAELLETGMARITDPVLKKLGNLMAQTRIARKATKILRRVEVGKRVSAAQLTYDSVLAETRDPDLALRMSTAQLTGKMPISTRALGESLTKEEALGLKLQIADHPTLSYFEKLRGGEAINKFLTTEELLQPSELKLLERVFPGISALNALKVKMGSSVWNQFIDMANLPRSLLASTDLSFTLRQGGILISRFPSEFKGVMASQFKTLASQKNWRAIMSELEKDPDWGLWLQYKGYAAPEPGTAVTIGAREEFFASRWAEKLIPTVTPSERAFTIGGNYLRFKSFKNLLEIARSANMTDDVTLSGLAKLVNYASGRGSIPAFLSARGGQGAGFINAFLFAPRYVFSRLQLPTLLFHASPLVRKEAARMLVQFMGAGTAVLSLAALAGAKIELDPRSSDFGKIRIGNTRLDIWTGYLQWARLLSQITTGTSKVVGTGEIADKNRLDILWNFVQSKESPAASIFTDLLNEETYTGAPVISWESLRSRITPLFIQDILDAIEADSLGMGAGIAVPSMLGVGAVSYEPKTTNTGLPSLPEYKAPQLPTLP